MRLVNKDMIHSKLIKNQSIILLIFGEQVLQAFASRGLLLLDGLDEVAVGTLGAGMFAQQLVIFRDLLKQEFLLIVARHSDSFKRRMCNNDAVPLTAGDLGRQELAAVAAQILLASDEELGVRVKLHELAGELLQQVVRHHVHRLLPQAGLLQFHAGRGHRERLAGADNVGQQRIAGTHASPNRVVLVGPEPDILVHAREVEVRAIEQPRPQIVVGVVVDADQTLCSLWIGEHP
jgi:hypothetical protein